MTSFKADKTSTAFALLTLLLLAACGSASGEGPSSGAPARPAPSAQEPPPPIVHPGAPGEPSRTGPPARVDEAAGPPSEADIRFIRGMIMHHGQALRMSDLATERAASDDVRLLARRIDRSQREEISMMERWLEAREIDAAMAGHTTPDADSGRAGHAAHHDPEPQALPTDSVPSADLEGTDHAIMPGMLTEAQLEALAEASGEAFDRMFLEFMIFHHQGAIVMVQELFASDDGGQGAEIYQLAAHIESDQRIEIDRMRRMLTRER